MAESLRALVAESLAVVRREAPPLWDRLGARMAGLTVDLALDGERFGVAGEVGGARVVDRPDGAEVSLRCDGRTLLDLMDGAIDLRAAVLTERLFLRGALAEIHRLLAALTIYLHAAVRAEGFAPLAIRLRAGIAEGARI